MQYNVSKKDFGFDIKLEINVWKRKSTIFQRNNTHAFATLVGFPKLRNNFTRNKRKKEEFFLSPH